MLGPIDWAIVLVYFVLLILIVWFTSRKQDSADEYFLAGRNVGWFVIGCSLFASNVGSEHIVGLAGSGATQGMTMAHWELHAYILIMLGWIFVPFYYTSTVSTMPEFLEKRFGSATRWILSVVSLAAYVLTKVSVNVYAGAIVFETLLPNTFGSPAAAFWVGALTTVILTGIYTIFGGFRAVLFTDTAQAFILIIGSALITWIGLGKLGATGDLSGWAELQSFAKTNVAEYALWHPLSDPEFPWLGILMASPIIGIWYWCTDQYIVQRTLAAKNLTVARQGTIWGAFLKVWPVMIFLVPGMIAAALDAKGVIDLPVTGDGSIDGDKVFATMVTEMLPIGLRGLVIGGLLAALMSSLSSLFNSCATLFTIDIYQKLRPKTSQAQLVNVGRIATAIVVVLGILWIPILRSLSEDSGLYSYLQSVQGYLAPSITAVFLLGLFYQRTNSPGAIVGLVAGFVMGMGKLTIELLYATEEGAEPQNILNSIADINFLYASGILFAITVVMVLLVSHMTSPPKDENLQGLTWYSIDKMMVRDSWSTIDVITTAIVLGLVVAIYGYFSFWI
ncbi:sodium:solute symporter [Mariniblastus fucicola]|uniref:Sodium/glucose cotransporter n=1 Tax=Mariniblastus fucicola TaxID=980251 RepID=A0A5B9PBX8_9BACT|nr:sodium:solute symporter [Mariniblastus fucicola]QEG22422.1 Sodium/glucose cotransporter [Mariniblastus fucicola]